MKWVVACLVCLMAKTCVAQMVTAKNATNFCLKKEETNTLEMYLNIDLNTDPQGSLLAINNTIYNQIPFGISEVTCVNTYNSTNKIYTVISVVDLDANSDAADDNVCGRVTKTDGSVTYYEWYFIHLTVPPASPSDPIFIRDRDVVYRAVCRMDNLTSNLLDSSVTVLTPNLQQDLTPTDLQVSMTVQRKDLATSQYTDILNSDTVDAGTTCRLRAVYERGSSYVAFLNAHSIYLYNVIVSPNSDFSNSYTLIKDDGCANVAGANIPPQTILTGFKGLISGTDNVLTTGDFFIWKFDSSPRLYFRANFMPCFEPDVSLCEDACLENTNQTEPVARKRRQADSNQQPGVLTVVIKVKDDSDVTRAAEISSETNTVVIVGAAVGAAFLGFIAIFVCLLAMMRRNKSEKKLPQTNFPVVVPAIEQKY